MKMDQAQHMKELEENARMPRAVPDLMLDKLILQEPVRGNQWTSRAAGAVSITSKG